MSTTATEADAEATRLYDAVFGRAPDADGLRFWSHSLQTGTPLHDVAEAFTHSPEFQARYGTPDDARFVDLLYENVLHRAPDDAGASFWRHALEAHAADRADVVLGFSESAEHVSHFAHGSADLFA